MLYRNTPRFQRLLQAALAIAAQERGYSDQRMIDDSGLKIGKSTLHRFRRASLDEEIRHLSEGAENEPVNQIGGFFLGKEAAKKLWDHLDSHGFIENS